MTSSTVAGAGFLDDDELLAILASEGAEFIRTAQAGDLDAPVPNCPGWTLRDLVAHLRVVYRWVARLVGERRDTGPGREELRALADLAPADGGALIQGVRDAHADLVHTLSAAGPDLTCWTVWPGPSARTFWIRRQVFETLVHRVDAQNCGARRTADGTELVPRIAADGIDEMVCGFLNRYAENLRAEVPTTIEFHATDTGTRWWIRLDAAAPTSGRGRAPAALGVGDALIEATAGELFLLLWNRRSAAGLDVLGDPAALDCWRRGAHR